MKIKAIKKYFIETIKYLMRHPLLIRPYINNINTLYNKSPEQLYSYVEYEFLSIFQKAYDKSPFYRSLYQNAGIKKDDVKCLNDITKLPVVTKDMVRENSKRLLTVSPLFVTVANTSGTTGTPLTLYHDLRSIWKEQAYVYCYRKKRGFVYGQPLVSLRGSLDRSIFSLKVHISNTLYLSSYHLNSSNILKYYKKIIKHSPKAIEGYPSSLYALALLLKEHSLQLSIPIAFTSSETLLDEQRSLICEQLNCEIYDHYGLTEQTMFLTENVNHVGYEEAPGYSINEYVEDGEICTNLINSSFPLIRYKSNDVMLLSTIDGKNMVKSIVGRVDDYVICKDGSRITRIDFVEGAQHIKATQWVQYEKGKLLISIVPEEGFSKEDEEYLLDQTNKRVGMNNMDVTLKLVRMEDLIYTSRGKFKLIVNLMKT